LSLSMHYYVLSLGRERNVLFEAFRDFLIEVENQGFPVVGPTCTSEALDEEDQRELSRRVDHCFGYYYASEPLNLVVVGERDMQSAFSSVTSHEAAVIARIEGDYQGTGTRDLGQIVWPVVKEAMSGLLDQVMRDLRTCEGQGHLAAGLEAVARAANQGVGATLLVENDYHLRGSLCESHRQPVLSPEIDIRDPIDDVIDAVIEKVLGFGGNVVFMPPGALSDRQRIVLLLPNGDPM
jgi:hypothetical protein